MTRNVESSRGGTYFSHGKSRPRKRVNRHPGRYGEPAAIGDNGHWGQFFPGVVFECLGGRGADVLSNPVVKPPSHRRKVVKRSLGLTEDRAIPYHYRSYDEMARATKDIT